MAQGNQYHGSENLEKKLKTLTSHISKQDLFNFENSLSNFGIGFNVTKTW